MSMKSIILITAICFSAIVNAQTHKCHTYELMQHQESLTPGYLNAVNESFDRAKMIQSQDRSTVHQINVVVHIVYNQPEENLADSVVFDQIARLNEDFRRLNADTTNLRDTFNTIVGDSFIEFQLATIDPQGNPTNGITRTQTTETSFIDFSQFPAEGVKSTADGGIDPWDQEHYLNIWVCNMSFAGTPFLLGYATPPNNLPHWPPGSADNMSDGVVIEYEAFGSNNPNTLDLGSGPVTVLGRTCVHEIGHYLGLRHIWGDGDCTEQDGIDDTPNALDQSNQDCDTTKNTCTDVIPVLGDLPDMVENYMDYSSEECQNSFTQGQIDLMRSIIENERVGLISPNPASLGTETELSFSVFPNPTNGSSIIKTNLIEPVQFELISKTGAILRTEMVQSTIEIHDLNPGVYFVRMSTENNSNTQKLVVL